MSLVAGPKTPSSPTSEDAFAGDGGGFDPPGEHLGACGIVIAAFPHGLVGDDGVLGPRDLAVVGDDGVLDPWGMAVVGDDGVFDPERTLGVGDGRVLDPRRFLSG